MLSNSPIEKPNQVKVKTASTASKLTVRVVGRLCNALRPAILTTIAQPPSIRTQVISGAVSEKSRQEKAKHRSNIATARG